MKWIIRLSLLTLALVIGGILYVGFLFIFPANPVTINSIAITSPQKVGTSMFYRFDSCKHVDVRGEVNRAIVEIGTNGYAYPYPEVKSVIPVGCSIKIIPLLLPATMPAGQYELVDSLTFKVNPFRSVQVTGVSNVFKVTP